KEAFDEGGKGQHDVRSIAVKGAQFDIMAQPDPGKHGRQMELPITGCGISASTSVGEIDAPLEKVPEGRMGNDHFLSPPFQKADGDIESPFHIVHETDMLLEEKIGEPCSHRVRASPGVDPR